MNTFRIVTAISLGFAISSAASAAGQAMNADSPAVEKLKSHLPSTVGFEVKDVRTGTDGTSCITYVVDNGNGGSSTQHAVVEGDKVLRDTTGNTRFASSWNKKCAKAGS
jgi:hypothetical protein